MRALNSGERSGCSGRKVARAGRLAPVDREVEHLDDEPRQQRGAPLDRRPDRVGALPRGEGEGASIGRGQARQVEVDVSMGLKRAGAAATTDSRAFRCMRVRREVGGDGPERNREVGGAHKGEEESPG